jgi:plastocyanin
MNCVPAMIKAAVLAAVLVLGGPALGGVQAAESDTVELSMSNFRYCAGVSCTPADQGYMRTASGPVPGTDNPHGIVDVPEGGTVRWVYRDVGPGSCDFFDQCPGHNVVFEDGSAKGARMGFVKSRSGGAAITATIGGKPGELVRYFCSVNNHYQLGMTGILRVKAAG